MTYTLYLHRQITIVVAYFLSTITLDRQIQAEFQSYCPSDIDLCYISPNTANGMLQMSWSDAQQWCRNNSATLATVEDIGRQNDFLKAIHHFNLDVSDYGDWIGANAIYYHNPPIWKWLDGTNYTGPAAILDIKGDQPVFNNSYAYIVVQPESDAGPTNQIQIYADQPTNSHYYICHYLSESTICTNSESTDDQSAGNDGCHVVYNDQLEWFNSRNKCLSNDGDLASFDDLSILLGLNSTLGYWIGLRSSWWNWQNAVTGETTAITFSQWRSDQPNDAKPHCISTDPGAFPTWRDYDCSTLSNFVCQLPSDSTSTGWTSSTSTGSTRNTPTMSTNERSSNPDTTSRSTISNNTTPQLNTGMKSVNFALALGLGIGLGVPFLVALIVIIIVTAVRRTRNSESTAIYSKSTTEMVETNGNIYEENEDADVTKTSSRRHTFFPPQNPVTILAPSPVQGVYGEVQTVADVYAASNDAASTSVGLVYAELDFSNDIK